MQWAEVPVALREWLQNAGAVAMIGLAIFGLAYLIRRPEYAAKTWDWITRKVVLLAACAAGTYAVLAIFLVAQIVRITSFSPRVEELVRDIGLAAGGLLALAAVLLPIVASLVSRLRAGRIGALARLSLKEAIRNRVVHIFAGVLLLFLFASWFVESKAEHQVRNYVELVFLAMFLLFCLVASLLGAFGIPADVRSQAIHTIVTKPVERFEIVLGRFLGYGLLLTAGLAVLTAISLLYVVRGVNPRAAEESFKARVPLYSSKLWFWGVAEAGKKSDIGVSVGREWNYRSYISGPHPRNPTSPKQYAVWSFDSVPRHLGEQLRPVRFEFGFDIFRLSKGEEGLGVFCTFTFADGRLEIPQVEKLAEKWRNERNDLLGLASKTLSGDDLEREKQKIEEKLISKYGLYEVGGVEVMDYHTQTPGKDAETQQRIGSRLAHLCQKLNELEESQPREGDAADRPPALSVIVNVDRSSGSQMLGVAKADLYMLAAERSFIVNFFKGMLGIWFVMLLVLGVAVTSSTYLSGVISWFVTLAVFIAGLSLGYMREHAEGKAVGGGPFESLLRLGTRQPQGAPLEPSPTSTVAQTFDEAFRWWMRRLVNVVPDVVRFFDMRRYVANGFDISWGQILFLDSLLPLVGFLIPCGILGFYLMKFREIANPT
jgi:hypothetical protein